MVNTIRLALLSIMSTIGVTMGISYDDTLVQKFMKKTLGEPMDTVYHAAVPFELGYDAGGAADVYQFRRSDRYVSYVTGDLIGQEQKPSDAGNYELLIVMKEGEQWGVNLIRMLAFSTMDESLNSGETMDIGAFGKPVGFDAILFDKYSSTTIDGKEIGLMLVIGITKQELKWKMKNGGKELITKLKEAGMYPFSMAKRKSIVK
jgi:hypothetical protein